MADARHNQRVGVVEPKGGRCLLGAGDEQLHRFVPDQALSLDRLGWIRYAERRHSPCHLTWQMECLTAGGENGDAGAFVDDGPDEHRCGVDHVLAVVQHQEEFPGGELRAEGCSGGPRPIEGQPQARTRR